MRHFGYSRDEFHVDDGRRRPAGGRASRGSSRRSATSRATTSAGAGASSRRAARSPSSRSSRTTCRSRSGRPASSRRRRDGAPRGERRSCGAPSTSCGPSRPASSPCARRRSTRIAREVHDEVGQALTAIKMDVAGVERALEAAGGAPRAVTERLRRDRPAPGRHDGRRPPDLDGAQAGRARRAGPRGSGRVAGRGVPEEDRDRLPPFGVSRGGAGRRGRVSTVRLPRPPGAPDERRAARARGLRARPPLGRTGRPRSRGRRRRARDRTSGTSTLRRPSACAA